MSFSTPQDALGRGLLSFLYSSEVHQMVSLDTSSITMNLSLGERPVYTPVITLTAPISVTCPLSNPCKLGLVSSLNNCSKEGL